MNARDMFISYFEKGCTDKERIGLELEHFITKNGRPVGFFGGVGEIVAELSEKAVSVFSENGEILGCDMGEYTLTLEPGAQLEVSVVPKEDVADIKAVLNSFYSIAEPVCQRYGVRLEAKATVSEEILPTLDIIPKKRYEFMDRYFETSGTMGRYMMRGSASTQVSIDYKDETDFIKKFRLAYLLSPFFALFLTNTDPTDKSHLKRLEIWDNVDIERTKIPDSLFESSFGFSTYADMILDVSAIFVPWKDGYIYTGKKKISELSVEYPMDEKMTEHYLSMVFPDVRLKKYIEIRIGDSVGADKAIEYAQLVKGIFYSDAVDKLLARYKDIGVRDIITAKKEIRNKGKNAVIYGKDASSELEYLLTILKS